MGDLNELVERVKAATGPDRELDYAISRFADGELARHSSLHLPYTASIDAALALTERMLPGWDYVLEGASRHCFVLMHPDNEDGEGVFVETAATSALAILAALLTALSLDTNKGDGV